MRVRAPTVSPAAALSPCPTARLGRALRVAATIGGVFVGPVLLVAVWSKMIDPEAFPKVIRAHGLDLGLPAHVLALIALGIEVGLGVALVRTMGHRPILLAASALTALFRFLTDKAYLHALQGRVDEAPSCACFGNLLERMAAQAFWQDVLLQVCALALAWLRPTPGPWWRVSRAGRCTENGT